MRKCVLNPVSSLLPRQISAALLVLIIRYIDASIQENPFRATLYMEYYDKGALDMLIANDQQKRKGVYPDMISEGFIWYALRGFADALTYYLRTGKSHITMIVRKEDETSWAPILHRDITPDNVLLRLRETRGFQKLLYVVVSDFGVAFRDIESTWALTTDKSQYVRPRFLSTYGSPLRAPGSIGEKDSPFPPRDKVEPQ
ncbi:hypothetical protein F4778DRAFT_787374 [Xylariomycetidae sp. FL2044]|nr:hypothetical protein F4778DRAFT_787374 [Xylariomycetidae sp. FL2044]